MTMMKRGFVLLLLPAACSLPVASDGTARSVSMGVGVPVLVDFQPGANVYEICVGVNQSTGSLTFENNTEGMLVGPTTAVVSTELGDGGPSGCPTKVAGVDASAWAAFRWATSAGMSHMDVRYTDGAVTSSPLGVDLQGSRFLGYTASVDKLDQQTSFTRFDATVKYAPPAGAQPAIAPGVTYTILTLPSLNVQYPTDPAQLVTGPTGNVTIILDAPTEATQVFITPQGGDLTLLQDISPP
jgi:hypothetical protein